MNLFARRVFPRDPAFALVVVLALLVLLAGLTLAYFSRVTGDRQVAHSSFNQSKVDQLAASAMEIIIGNLRQEIVYGSTATPIGSSTIYVPKSNYNMAPQISPTPTPGT